MKTGERTFAFPPKRSLDEVRPKDPALAAKLAKVDGNRDAKVQEPELLALDNAEDAKRYFQIAAKVPPDFNQRVEAAIASFEARLQEPSVKGDLVRHGVFAAATGLAYLVSKDGTALGQGAGGLAMIVAGLGLAASTAFMLVRGLMSGTDKLAEALTPEHRKQLQATLDS